MADNSNTTTTSSTNQTSASTINHLGTDVPSGNIDNSNNVRNEKQELSDNVVEPEKTQAAANDDEDMDALIDELKSQDGGADQEEDEEDVGTGEAPPVPEDLLQTDTRMGLTEHEVIQRRKKYGLNQMKEEKENLILKFLGYFIGPIQFVMEVCFAFTFLSSCMSFRYLVHRGVPRSTPLLQKMLRETWQPITTIVMTDAKNIFYRQLPCSLQVCKIGSISVSFALFYCSMLPSVSSRNSRPTRLSTS